MSVEMINEAICDRPEILCDALEIEGKIYNDKMDVACHIHGGDNPHGMTIYFNEYYGRRGCFKCHTRSCQNTFKSTLLGLTRGILSNRYCGWSKPGDKIYGWNDTLKYLQGLYNIDGAESVDPAKTDRNNFIRQCGDIEEKKDYICTRDKYMRTLTSPSKYFNRRGFSESVLNEYDIRHYSGNTYVYQSRSIIPVFNDENRLLRGFTARSEDNREPRWLYSGGFPAATSLFNYAKASEHIRRKHSVILTEGPLDVLCLREAGINECIAIWGASAWNDYKRYLLDKLGVMRVVLALDNDAAGAAGREKIIRDTRRYYNTTEVLLPDGKNDIADLTIEEIKSLFKGII